MRKVEKIFSHESVEVFPENPQFDSGLILNGNIDSITRFVDEYGITRIQFYKNVKGAQTGYRITVSKDDEIFKILDDESSQDCIDTICREFRIKGEFKAASWIGKEDREDITRIHLYLKS